MERSLMAERTVNRLTMAARVESDGVYLKAKGHPRASWHRFTWDQIWQLGSPPVQRGALPWEARKRDRKAEKEARRAARVASQGAATT